MTATYETKMMDAICDFMGLAMLDNGEIALSTDARSSGLFESFVNGVVYDYGSEEEFESNVVDDMFDTFDFFTEVETVKPFHERFTAADMQEITEALRNDLAEWWGVNHYDEVEEFDEWLNSGFGGPDFWNHIATTWVDHHISSNKKLHKFMIDEYNRVHNPDTPEMEV